MSCERMRAPSFEAARPARSQHGFTLIESMVALLVLSVGLIGIAALHGHGLNASRTAYYRTIAINLSEDMADRIRLNRTAGADYELAAANNNCDPFRGAPVQDCTPTELARHDRFVWEGLVADALPNGAGGIAVDAATNPPTYTITVTWDEVGQGQLTHTAELQLPQF